MLSYTTDVYDANWVSGGIECDRKESCVVGGSFEVIVRIICQNKTIYVVDAIFLNGDNS